MADIEELIERLEFLRCQPNSKRSNDAVDDALETAAELLRAQQKQIEELRFALVGADQLIAGLPMPEEYADRAYYNKIQADIRAALNTPSQEGEKR